MRRVLLGLAITTLGCAQVFDIHTKPPVDAADFACGAPPQLASWAYAPFAFAPTITESGTTRDADVRHPTLSGDRVAFEDATDGNLYEGTRTGPTVTLLLDLLPGPNVTDSPSFADAGNTLWYRVVDQGSPPSFVKLVRATRRDAAWEPHLVDLGLSTVQPGSSGAHAEILHLVVAHDFFKQSQLVEYTSMDGVAWTRVSTIPFSAGASDDRDPYLSPDACWLLYVSAPDASANHQLRLASRADARDPFGDPVDLAVGSSEVRAPTVQPDATEMWFLGDQGVTRGSP